MSAARHGLSRAKAPFGGTRTACVRRAFTLVEVLIALALIGTVSIIVVVSVDDLLDSARKSSPFEVLRNAVDKAWYAASTKTGTVFLYYDEGAGRLVLRDTSAQPLAEFSFEDERVGPITFQRTPDTGGGTLAVSSTEPFPYLTFSPWGGATPAIIEMEIAGEVYRYQMEPFSGGLEALR